MSNVVRQRGVGRRTLIVFAPFAVSHDGVEILGIEIDQPRFATLGCYGVECGVAHGCTEAFRYGMAIDDQNPHQNASILRATLAMKRSRD